MQTMSSRLSPASLGRLRLRMRSVLRPFGGYNQARQSPSGCNAGGYSPIQSQSTTCRDHWFAERAYLGTPLSDDELRHGVKAGIISSTLLGISND